MAWITLSATDVKAHLADVELSALQAGYLAAGQADPLVEIIAQVAGRVRRAVGKGGGTLGAAGTIPDELEHVAVALARYSLCNRLNAALVTEDRRQEYRDAITELKEVAEDATGIVAPATPAADQPAANVPDISEKTRNFDSTDQDGI